MSERTLGSVTIVDNGLTSFVPPCFHWELRDSQGELVETVSDIDSSLMIAEVGEIVRQKMLVSGKLVNYPLPSGELGVRFIIESVR